MNLKPDCRRSTCSRASPSGSRSPPFCERCWAPASRSLFWLPRLGLAALCHPMLPTSSSQSEQRVEPEALPGAAMSTLRFAICRPFDALGTRAQMKSTSSCLEAPMFCPVPTADSRPTVGGLNCEAALRVLREEGSRVAASSLGGTSGLTHSVQHTDGRSAAPAAQLQQPALRRRRTRPVESCLGTSEDGEPLSATKTRV